MFKTLTGIGAVAALAVTMVAAPQPAQARHWHHRGGGVGAGIIGGLAAGALIGSAGGYYGGGYGYGPGPYYGYGGGCYLRRERIWTHYGPRWRRVRVCY